MYLYSLKEGNIDDGVCKECGIEYEDCRCDCCSECEEHLDECLCEICLDCEYPTDDCVCWLETS